MRFIPASIRRVARRVLRPSLHKAEIVLPYKVYGTDYGGWPLLDQITPIGALIYSFGVGEDISFDIGAIQQFDAQVHAFDPTPRSLAWVERQDLPSNFVFHPVGIAAINGEVEFFAPAKDGNVSYSSDPADRSDLGKKISAPVKRLSSLIQELGTPPPQILKLDVEGFEYDVIADVLASGILPDQWLIEFHHRMYNIAPLRTEKAVDLLRANGYLIFYVSESGHEYGFVRENALPQEVVA
jgi:FkbM family methyltransferase